MLDWPAKALCGRWLASCAAPAPDGGLQGRQLVCPHHASQPLQAGCRLAAVVFSRRCHVQLAVWSAAMQPVLEVA